MAQSKRGKHIPQAEKAVQEQQAADAIVAKVERIDTAKKGAAMLRRIEERDCTITLEAETEHDNPKDHFDSGDKDDDAKMVKEIWKDYESGNNWAWCCAKVTVTCGALKSEQYLGCCSFKNEEDFKESGYYEQMISEALDELNAQLDEIKAKLV